MVAAYVDAANPKLETARTNTGGLAHVVDKWTRLERFLILGSEGGTYYVTERDLTKENVTAIEECLVEDAKRTIETITRISTEGRAAKNDPAIFALALASVKGDVVARKFAFRCVPVVCRIGTHLLHFAAYREALGGGWGRGTRNAVGAWFTGMGLRDLAYQAVKYPSRDGWALRDLLRLSHPKPWTTERALLLKYVTQGADALMDAYKMGLATKDWAEFLMVIETIKVKAPDTRTVVGWIEQYRIPREALPTELLNEPLIWEALLKDMPMTAMLRNLGKMGSVGILDLGSWGEGQVIHALSSVERMKKARVHPLAILSALKIYQSGKGFKGRLSWIPNKRIVNALDEAFYTSFATITPSNARIRLAIDVSGSMVGNKIAGMEHIDARTGAAVMALVTVATEPKADVVAFSNTMVPLKISPNMRLDEVMRIMNGLPFGGTLCSLPVMDALHSRENDIEGFVTYTDSETMDGYSGWGGIYVNTAYGPRSRQRIEIPATKEAMRQYRQASGLKSRYVTVGMCANQFSIADPNDELMLDVVGMDSSTPQVITDFVAGRI